MPRASSSPIDDRGLGSEVGYVVRMFPQTSETFIANEILQLEKLGFRIRVFSLLRPSEGTIRHQCVRSIRAPVHYVDLGQEDASACAERIASMVRGTPVRHLHAHFAHIATEVAWRAARLSGRPFSFTAHAKDIYTAEPHDLRRKIEAADFVVTCTRANRGYLRTLVGPAHTRKLTHSYHGVDTRKFAPGGHQLAVDEPLILSVGRLVRKKGFPFLIRACNILESKGHRARYVIVGDGPERNHLEALIRRLGMGARVRLQGALGQEELLDYYRAATVFALPCEVQKDGDRDALPIVLMEAMAVGLPVISSPVNGIPELIRPRENGLLVDEADSEGLALALERLLGDEEMRQRLGRNARSTVKRDFEAASHASYMARLFVTVLR